MRLEIQDALHESYERRGVEGDSRACKGVFSYNSSRDPKNEKGILGETHPYTPLTGGCHD